MPRITIIISRCDDGNRSMMQVPRPLALCGHYVAEICEKLTNMNPVKLGANLLTPVYMVRR